MNPLNYKKIFNFSIVEEIELYYIFYLKEIITKYI